MDGGCDGRSPKTDRATSSGRPSARSGAATDMSRRCCVMCALKCWWARASSGPISASATTETPARNASRWLNGRAPEVTAYATAVATRRTGTSTSGMDVDPGDDRLLGEDQNQVETCDGQTQPTKKGSPTGVGPRLFTLQRFVSGSDQVQRHDDAARGDGREHHRDAVHQPNHPVVLLCATHEGGFGHEMNGPRCEWSDDGIPNDEKPLAMFTW